VLFIALSEISWWCGGESGATPMRSVTGHSMRNASGAQPRRVLFARLVEETRRYQPWRKWGVAAQLIR
jgi:hypothetical protein